jgi:hypothetical protein
MQAQGSTILNNCPVVSTHAASSDHPNSKWALPHALQVDWCVLSLPFETGAVHCVEASLPPICIRAPDPDWRDPEDVAARLAHRFGLSEAEEQ